LNAIYGVEAWNFGSRTLKGRKGNRNLEKAASQMKAEPDALPVAPSDMATAAAAAAADATDGEDYNAAVEMQQAVASPVRRVPSKKTGGVRKGGAGSKALGKKAGVVQICRDCAQVSLITMTVIVVITTVITTIIIIITIILIIIMRMFMLFGSR